MGPDVHQGGEGRDQWPEHLRRRGRRRVRDPQGHESSLGKLGPARDTPARRARPAEPPDRRPLSVPCRRGARAFRREAKRPRRRRGLGTDEKPRRLRSARARPHARRSRGSRRLGGRSPIARDLALLRRPGALALPGRGQRGTAAGEPAAAAPRGVGKRAPEARPCRGRLRRSPATDSTSRHWHRPASRSARV
jgi:hypothetical protein